MQPLAKMKKVFCYCFDRKGMIPFSTSIYSLMCKVKGPKRVYCITRGVDCIPLSLVDLACQYGCEITQIDLSRGVGSYYIDNYCSPGGMTASSFDRLLIPELLPVDINSCLYLDVDTLVLSDFNTEFFSSLERSKFLFSFRPSTTSWISMRVVALERVGQDMAKTINRDWTHGNIGIMGINMRPCRLRRPFEDAFACAEKYSTTVQTALNYILEGNFERLNSTYNVLANQECITDLPRATILHYAGHKKPWRDKLQCESCKSVWWDYYHSLRSSGFECSFCGPEVGWYSDYL